MFVSNDLPGETAFALAGLSHWPMPCVPKSCVLGQMMFRPTLPINMELSSIYCDQSVLRSLV